MLTLPVGCGLGRGSHRAMHRAGLDDSSMEIENVSPLIWGNRLSLPLFFQGMLPGSEVLKQLCCCLTGDFTRGSSRTATEQKLCLAGVTPRAELLGRQD